ncbi:MAG: PIG-L family deacetylase [Verrucomicrobia bacterium]|nr:PIG-L family deacetylase [Verrucomicrobiota bacterium]
MITLNPRARLMIPDGSSGPEALRRTTHLGIGAHQDDLEFMAFHGILACYDRSDRWFGGVTITDGRGSSRTGEFKDWSDDQIAAERIQEQDKAAVIGQYAFMAQLGYPSASVRDARETAVRADLLRLLEATRPEVIYLHNLADKHDTHVGCALRCIEALRLLPKCDRPKKAYGCEVWRDLDWLVDTEKTPMPVSGRPELARALNEVFATQIAGGKRYDLAVLGRRTANATFGQAHSADRETAMQWAMDLTPLVQDDTLDPLAYAVGFIDRLKADVTERIRKSL